MTKQYGSISRVCFAYDVMPWKDSDRLAFYWVVFTPVGVIFGTIFALMVGGILSIPTSSLTYQFLASIPVAVIQWWLLMEFLAPKLGESNPWIWAWLPGTTFASTVAAWHRYVAYHAA